MAALPLCNWKGSLSWLHPAHGRPRRAGWCVQKNPRSCQSLHLRWDLAGADQSPGWSRHLRYYPPVPSRQRSNPCSQLLKRKRNEDAWNIELSSFVTFFPWFSVVKDLRLLLPGSYKSHQTNVMPRLKVELVQVDVHRHPVLHAVHGEADVLGAALLIHECWKWNGRFPVQQPLTVPNLTVPTNLPRVSLRFCPSNKKGWLTFFLSRSWARSTCTRWTAPGHPRRSYWGPPFERGCRWCHWTGWRSWNQSSRSLGRPPSHRCTLSLRRIQHSSLDHEKISLKHETTVVHRQINIILSHSYFLHEPSSKERHNTTWMPRSKSHDGGTHRMLALRWMLWEWWKCKKMRYLLNLTMIDTRLPFRSKSKSRYRFTMHQNGSEKAFWQCTGQTSMDRKFVCSLFPLSFLIDFLSPVHRAAKSERGTLTYNKLNPKSDVFYKATSGGIGTKVWYGITIWQCKFFWEQYVKHPMLTNLSSRISSLNLECKNARYEMEQRLFVQHAVVILKRCVEALALYHSGISFGRSQVFVVILCGRPKILKYMLQQVVPTGRTMITTKNRFA